MKQLFFILVFVLLGVFDCLAQKVYENEYDKVFPAFSFYTIDGEKIDSTYIKNKIIVCNFYFEACEACRVEMNALNNLYDKYNNEDIVFIAITPDNIEKAKLTREKYELKYKIVSLPKPEIRELMNKTNYPTNIIVDKSGKIAFKESGTVMPEKYTIIHVMETFGKIIEELNKK